MRFLRSKGGVLIELAFGVPILILMMYFCLDIPKAYQFVNKIQTASELTAAMILNVKAGEIDKTLSLEDLKYVSRALKIYFLGNPNVKGEEFHIFTYVTCVTGEKGKIKKNWSVGIDNDVSKPNRIETYTDSSSLDKFSGAASHSISENLNNTSFSGFGINEGETKLIVETFVWQEETALGINKRFYMMSLPMSLIGNRFAVVTPHLGMVSAATPPKEDTKIKEQNQ